MALSNPQILAQRSDIVKTNCSTVHDHRLLYYVCVRVRIVVVVVVDVILNIRVFYHHMLFEWFCPAFVHK